MNRQFNEFVTKLQLLPPEELLQQLPEALEKFYRQGYIDALTNYAVWRDGVQTVGALNRPLPQVVEEFMNSDIPVRY